MHDKARREAALRTRGAKPLCPTVCDLENPVPKTIEEGTGPIWRRGFLYGKDGGKRPRHLSTRVAHPNAASDVAEARVLEGPDAEERWEGTSGKAAGCKDNAWKYCD